MRNVLKRLVISAYFFSAIVLVSLTVDAIEAIRDDEAETPDTSPPAADE